MYWIVVTAVVSAIFAVVAGITQVLWGEVMPVLFGLPPISFWQAACLIILSRLLFVTTNGLETSFKKKR